MAGTVTVSGTREVAKLTEVDGFALELAADGILLFFRYADRPGVVGAIGSILGESGVNIAAMQVARREAGGEALMTLTVDSAVDAELLASAQTAIGAGCSSTGPRRRHSRTPPMTPSRTRITAGISQFGKSSAIDGSTDLARPGAGGGGATTGPGSDS